MDFPLQIAFEGVKPSDELRVCVGDEVAQLGELADRIKLARVVLGRPQRRNHRADACRVHSQLEGLDGSDITITRDPAITGVEEDVHATIKDAFTSLRRRLEQLSERS